MATTHYPYEQLTGLLTILKLEKTLPPLKKDLKEQQYKMERRKC